MGQIIGGAAKPKRCNLNKLSQLGTPAAGEHILVSSDNSMIANGQGNFDCYIVGDGRTAAAALELKHIDPEFDVVFKYVTAVLTPAGVKDGSYIAANNGSLGTSSAFRLVYYDVKVGDVIDLYIDGGVGTSISYCLYNTSDPEQIGASTKYKHGWTLKAASGNTQKIEVTQDGLLAVTTMKAATFSFSVTSTVPNFLEDRVAELEKKCDDVENTIFNTYEGELPVDGMLYGTLIQNADGTLGANANFNLSYYNVTAGDVISLTISGGVGSAISWGFFNTENPSEIGSSTCVRVGSTLANSNTTQTINVSSGGILAVTRYVNATTNVVGNVKNYIPDAVSKLEEQAETTWQKKTRYLYYDGVVRVAFAYGDKDLLISLRKTGNNNIFDFSHVATIPKYGRIGTSTMTAVFAVSTDWHSPFKIEALNDIDGDNLDNGVYKDYFTGGNHDYTNGTGGGSATGRTENIRVFADGYEINDGEGSAETIVIMWTNYVQAQNTTKADGTGREVLQENHTLMINGNKFNEQVELIPLEALKIKSWYGFQYSNVNNIYPNTKFVGATRKMIYPYTSSSGDVCGDNTTNIVVGKGTTHQITMFFNPLVDLGKHYASGANSLFRSGSKMYGYPVNNLSVNQGEHYYLEGGWQFEPAND